MHLVDSYYRKINVILGCHRACEIDVPRNVILLRQIFENIPVIKVFFFGGGYPQPVTSFWCRVCFLLGLHLLLTGISGFRRTVDEVFALQGCYTQPVLVVVYWRCGTAYRLHLRLSSSHRSVCWMFIDISGQPVSPTSKGLAVLTRSRLFRS